MLVYRAGSILLIYPNLIYYFFLGGNLTVIATPTPTSKPAGAVTPTPAKPTGVDTSIPTSPEQQQFKTECKPGKCILKHRFANQLTVILQFIFVISFGLVCHSVAL